MNIYENLTSRHQHSVFEYCLRRIPTSGVEVTEQSHFQYHCIYSCLQISMPGHHVMATPISQCSLSCSLIGPAPAPKQVAVDTFFAKKIRTATF